MKEFGTTSDGAKLLKKMNYKEFFKIKHPILAAPMNQVSDGNLAVACANAGILPSLSVYTWSENYNINYPVLENIVKDFQDRSGTENILLSAGVGDLLSYNFFNFVQKFNIKHIEVIGNDKEYSKIEPEVFPLYKKHNIKVIGKVISHLYVKDHLDGVIIKGKNGAGRGLEVVDEDAELEKIKEIFPKLSIVMSGGVGCRDDVKKYLNLGCTAVAIGTLLAASEESCLSKETKLKMVQSSWKDITKLDNGAHQNGLVFSKVENDDYNNTKSLRLGMKDPTQGHVFAGKGLDHINAILPVKDVIQLLTDGL